MSVNQTTAVVQSLLGQLWPIRDLDQSQQIKLLKKSRMDSYAGGKRLSASEEQNWLVYLLDGRVNLLTDKGIEPLSPPSARTQQPLFSGRNLREAAIVQGHARILRVDRRYLEILSREQTNEGIEVSDVQITHEENLLFQEIYTRYSQGELSVPNLPVAGRVAARLQQPQDLPAEDVAGLASLDPGLLAGILQTANAPAYREEGGTTAEGKVGSLIEAIRRLGDDLPDLADGLAIRHAFSPRHEETASRLDREWQRSLLVGAICHTLAQQFPELDPERARLIGLLHRLGALVILMQLDARDDLSDLAASDHAVETLQALVGVLVVSGLDMDGHFSSAIEQSREWLRDEEGPVDYLDILLVAQLVHDADTGRLPADLPPLDDLPVVRKLELGARSENLRALLLLDAEEEVARLRRLLEGEGTEETETPALSAEIDLPEPPRRRPKSRPDIPLYEIMGKKGGGKPSSAQGKSAGSAQKTDEAAYQARLAELGLSERDLKPTED